MIADILKSIDAAEKTSEDILNYAQKNADEIIKTAYKNGDEKISILKKQLRSEHKACEVEAVSGGKDTKKEAKAHTEQKLNMIRQNADKNMDKAVEFILERVLTV